MLNQHKLTNWHGTGTDTGHVLRQRAEVQFAASIDRRLGAFIAKLALDPKLSAAEITRRAGRYAEELGMRRPSYAAVRLLVADARLEARLKAEERSWADVLIGVATRADHPDVIVDKYVGLLNKHLPEDYGIRHERR